MSDLSIPKFLKPAAAPERAPEPYRPSSGDSLAVGIIASVRYDYEVSLMSIAEIGRKYAGIISPSMCWAISVGKIRPEIRAAHHPLKLCKRWRNK